MIISSLGRDNRRSRWSRWTGGCRREHRRGGYYWTVQASHTLARGAAPLTSLNTTTAVVLAANDLTGARHTLLWVEGVLWVGYPGSVWEKI